MKPRVRAFLGAAVGAVAVLVLSPQTRPGLLSAFSPASGRTLATLLARPPLRPPTNADTGAAYLHAGAERLQADRRLAVDERRTLSEIVRRGEASEPENSFWPLAYVVFHPNGDPEVRNAWRRASRCHRYFDHQRSDIMSDIERVSNGGYVQAWMYAAVAPGRSAAMIDRIASAAVGLARSTRPGDERTELAYETIRNGAMIRDGSERLSLGRVGIAMIERAAYPARFGAWERGSLTRRLWIAKATLTLQLRREGRAEDATICDREFRLNDASNALRDVIDPDARFDARGTLAVYVDVLPGAFLAVSLLGGLLWLFGCRIEAVSHPTGRFEGPGLIVCAMVLLLLGVVIGYPSVGLAAGLCALVPALGPERPRRYGDEPLGPLHSLIVASLALALSGSVILATVASSLPGQILPVLGDFGPALGDAARWAAVGIVTLGASAFVAPAWALVRRYPTPALAAHTYRLLGRTMAIGGILLAIAASPIALALNHWVGDSLAEIALNEQIAYQPETG